MSLVRGPGETSPWIWKVLHPCWSSWVPPPEVQEERLLPLGFSGRQFFCLMHGNLETHPPKFGEVIAVVQQTVSGHPWENLVHQLEVCHWNHGEGFPCVEIYEWHSAIVWHGYLGEQVAVLCSMVFPPVGLGQVGMLEQGVADADVGA